MTTHAMLITNRPCINCHAIHPIGTPHVEQPKPTPVTTHALLVPVSGSIEVLHLIDVVGVRNELEARSEGDYIEFGIRKDNHDVVTVHMLVGDNAYGYGNTRAREVVVYLTGGVHFYLTGNVAFTDLDEEDVAIIMEMFG